MIESKQNRCSTSAPPDILSRVVYDKIWHNPTATSNLLAFAKEHHCDENITFIQAVDRYEKLIAQVIGLMSDIDINYISDKSSPFQLNLDAEVTKTTVQDVQNNTLSIFPQVEKVFATAKHKIDETIFTDIYPRFVQHQLSLDVRRTMAGVDPCPYQGVGDCFCISDPARPDIPITYASDGFLSVTGYERYEVIGRNCRFLQGPETSGSVVKKLHNDIINYKESVELLLNYRKDGSMFWNLLHIAPLIGPSGKVELFLGGQINLSSAVHDHLDALNILSYKPSTATTPTFAENNKSKRPKPPTDGHNSGVLGFLRARPKSQAVTPVSSAPMSEHMNLEGRILQHLDNLDLAKQKEVFHSAYSKYLIFTPEDFKLRFTSAAITKTLTKIYNNDPTHFYKMDIFKVLQKLTGDTHGIKTNKNLVEKTIHRGVPAATSLRLYNGSLWDDAVDNQIHHILKRTNSHGSGNSNSNSASGGESSPPEVGSRDNSMELVELSLIWTPMKDLAGHSGYAIVTLIM